MKIIDTHSHLYSDKFTKDLDEVIERGKEVLHAIFLPNINNSTLEAMNALHQRDPNFFFPMIGLHPCDVQADWEDELTKLKASLDKGTHSYFGIGETGIDLYWDP